MEPLTLDATHVTSPGCHTLSAEETLKNLQTQKTGLSQQEAQQRLQQYGLNELQACEEISPWKIFLSQFENPIVWILVAAVVISGAIGEYLDAIVIGVILIANAVIGFVQEYHAQKAIDALKKMVSLQAIVLRDGKEKKIDATQLVPGDVILLEAGEKIPADARILELTELQLQEAILTGESVPVEKSLNPVRAEALLGDRKNMVFSGTTITSGKAAAVVCKTGMKTEIGNIACMLNNEKQEATPLQKSLKVLGKWLGLFTLGICIVVFVTGILKGEPILEFFIVAVSLAVAAIPEGLPAVVTIALALGVQKMAKKNALVRKLPSVETLGCTTVICTDKTGTLTHNQMTVRKVYVDNETIEVTGVGYNPQGTFSKKTADLPLLLQIGVLNNDARVNGTADEIFGDPTEGSLLISGLKLGLNKSVLKLKYPRLKEFLFTSERKRMTTIHTIDNQCVAYTKGAVDVILERCSKIMLNGKVQTLTAFHKQQIIDKNEEFATQALRVLGFAYRPLAKNESQNDALQKLTDKATEKDLIFVGMQAMIDPPRKEAKEAIARCKEAGIKVIMITGDHKSTALAIAQELGLYGKAVTGDELKNINLVDEVEKIAVFARVNPEHKLDIVNALKQKGHIVAMTGDGVNDAPALKKADIGIAMGISGTDVAKEASTMILTDDNFASIVNAVEEGRTIYSNIRKFVTYLLSSNIGEVLTIFIAILIGMKLPLLAIMILWMNLVTDGLPALALGVDPAEPGIMTKKPRDPKEKILNGKKGAYLFALGIIMTIGTLFLFQRAEKIDYAYATTMAFTTLMMYEMFNVMNCRSDEESIFTLGLTTNKKLLFAIASSVALQLLVIYTPLNTFFKTVPLTGMDWVWIIAVSSSVLWFGEVWKMADRKIHENPMNPKA
ncbi:TPA: calcium-translocating P-type ATPase, SERCA-type [Candidatus Woesearchaeota archaeon]|nr:calcium-translocating P-type ATPase, SERCA-type [Candidatus Woesearchaeota archaeon]